MTGRVMKSVLHNFLETYTSRYSDHAGYWLFGFLEAEELSINLLEGSIDASESKTPDVLAAGLARRKFSEQATKAKFTVSRVRSAELAIRKWQESRGALAGSRVRVGHDFDFTVTVTLMSGRTFVSHKTVFVAPHDATAELRRRPADWGVEGLR